MGPSGRPTAVYLRCTYTCRAYRYDLVAGTRAPDSLRAQCRAGGSASERLGEHVAFLSDAGVLLAGLRTRRPPALFARRGFREIELGRGALATVEFASRDRDHVNVVLAVRSRPRARFRVLRERIIGGRCATGIGGLQYEGAELLWKEVRGCGCTITGMSFFACATAMLASGRAPHAACGSLRARLPTHPPGPPLRGR